eukprot:1212139-Rhodomonas_salina.1
MPGSTTQSKVMSVPGTDDSGADVVTCELGDPHSAWCYESESWLFTSRKVLPEIAADTAFEPGIATDIAYGAATDSATDVARGCSTSSHVMLQHTESRA